VSSHGNDAGSTDCSEEPSYNTSANIPTEIIAIPANPTRTAVALLALADADADGNAEDAAAAELRPFAAAEARELAALLVADAGMELALEPETEVC